MLQYLIKFSISLAVLYVFYKIVLRPLTFYQWNRFYLLCYSLLSFVIPFVNITPWVVKQGVNNNGIINIIPTIGNYGIIKENIVTNQPSLLQRLTGPDWVLLFFCAGASVMLVRLLIQYLSLRRIRKQAILLNEDTGMAVQLYETNAPVSPFSFGNAIYFNRRLHTEEELQRIIQHEFVHVKQKHTIDLLAGELLCVVNWFNPFAWLIRYSIRQNLEFIADNNVVVNGVDKKEYQYLLLKVVGIPQYSIAGNFNFSNLKKRIAMMNKMKTAKLHLSKFLFVLPLLAVLLLALRQKNNEENKLYYAIIFYDQQTNEIIKGATVTDEQTNSVFVSDENGYVALPVILDKASVLHVRTRFNKQGYKDFERRFQINFNKTKKESVVELIGLQKGVSGNFCMNCLASMSSADKRGEELYNSTLQFYQLYLSGRKSKYEHEQLLKKFDPSKYITDTVPPPPPPPMPTVQTVDVKVAPNAPAAMANKKGYTITIADNNGEYIVIVKDKAHKIVKAASLVEWNKNKKQNEDLYGAVPAPPVQAITVVPLNTDASQRNQPMVPAIDTVRKRGINFPPENAPLLIIDGVVAAAGYDLNALDPKDIESITILKDKDAVEKYGSKAKNGAIEIYTKKIKQPKKKDAVFLNADSIILHKNLLVIKGSITVEGKESLIDGRMSFLNDFTEAPLVIYNGKQVTNLRSFKAEHARYRLLSLDKKDAVSKYGSKAKYGALEIRSL